MKMDLETMGYERYADKGIKLPDRDGIFAARVSSVYRGCCRLISERGDLIARISGHLRSKAEAAEDYPVVGDWVSAAANSDSEAVIYSILPRRTLLVRKSSSLADLQPIAANLDSAFIVQSPDRDFSLNRFDRYIALAVSADIRPYIVLNKTDIISHAEMEEIRRSVNSRFDGVESIFTSISISESIDSLRSKIMQGETTCFLGSSGVGKSSLINVLSGTETAKTGQISEATGRGLHITTNRELYFIEGGGFVIDTPGMREVGVLDSDAGINTVFHKISGYASNCRFSDCSHEHEPGCAVRAALENGDVDLEQYDSFMKLAKENKYNTMTKKEKREKDRQRGKFYKNAKKQVRRYKPR